METPDDWLFQALLESRWPELSQLQRDRLVRFRHRVVLESQRQNLTRLLSPLEFYEGHIEDCRALLESGWISKKMMDLGSGAGVPGLALAALDDSKSWILAESEGRKAAFLRDCISELNLDKSVLAFAGRGEAFLQRHSVDSIVVRAVGPVSRIHQWIRNCSTWNNLLLFKGPNWESEWHEFQEGPTRAELQLLEMKRYEVGSEKKQRVLVRLKNVPRGTMPRTPSGKYQSES